MEDIHCCDADVRCVAGELQKVYRVHRVIPWGAGEMDWGRSSKRKHVEEGHKLEKLSVKGVSHLYYNFNVVRKYVGIVY